MPDDMRFPARLQAPRIPRADFHGAIVQQWDPTHQLSPCSCLRSPDCDHVQNNGNTEIDVNTCHGGPQTSRCPEMPASAEDECQWQDQELSRKIMQQVEDNGITRPTGYNVSYHYNSAVEDMHFGRTHPMKPWRLTLAKHLILGYGLQYAMSTHEAIPAGKDQVCAFHDPDYVDFLSELAPETFDHLIQDPKYKKAIPRDHDEDTIQLGPYNLSTSPGADCPVFADMSTYVFLYTGATLAATHQLTTNQSDIAINWSGGLHHAHKSEASGFCYINDVVLSILDMLRVWARVLYIDIDVHHGDGVEEAFQHQPRVMTLSFHRYGTYDDTGNMFFPGTGDLTNIGLKDTIGEHFALNVPLGSGIDDRQYNYIFTSIVGRAVDAFNPSAIVLQCGADSLGGDRLGQFNMNIKQHGECVRFVKSLGRPVLLLGGGGYTARNVARAWCYETAIATDNELPSAIPLDLVPRPDAFQGRRHGDAKLFPPFQRLHRNKCKWPDLEKMVKKLEFDLRYVARCPWVQMDQLPRQRVMEGLVRDIDEEMNHSKLERDRKWKERAPAHPGELR